MLQSYRRAVDRNVREKFKKIKNARFTKSQLQSYF